MEEIKPKVVKEVSKGMKVILIVDKVLSVLIAAPSLFLILKGLSIATSTPDWFDFRFLGWLIIVAIILIVLPAIFIKNKILKFAITQNSIKFGILTILLQFFVCMAVVSILAIH